ncbi:transient receptor potential cation channel subfamily A member 1 isoform X1 [Rana temporaria]|uniref:transient receptor potential cation channel subfamily A member 1 isoform X1 n=1 Tax=Rana temporaria TaxID=8407 RepID=UPI001AADBF36|nr:transient receptor potential cation channel subfamily A member 1 isoform X1 [Rana temporaria]XP_040210341.1 transient receptor potential cation channel subfamily A member 1 isoform X1 [Rana temporaria]
MKKSIRRMFSTAVEKDNDTPYEGVILRTDSCTSIQADPQHIFKLVKEGHVCRVRSFILKNPSCLMARDDIEATPLHYAAKHGHLEIVFMIVNEGTDEALNALDSRGGTPLHWAIVKNQVGSVRILLSRGANPNLLNFYRLAPIHMAIQLHHNSIVEELLNHSTTDINLEGDLGNSPIMTACYKDNAEALIMLFNHGAKLCKRNKIGCYPIHMTAFAGSLKCMDLVLKKGEEFGYSIEDHINFTDNEKSSPLHVAVQNGRLEIVKACIEYGAKIDLKQVNDNATALHFASTQGATEIVKFMLSSYTGDNNIVDLPDGNNETPLHKSCLFDHADLADYLISMGANIDSIDNDFRTPLLLATSCSAWKTVNLLLEKGANVQLADNYGRNFLHLIVLQPGGLKNITAEVLKREDIKLLVRDEDVDGCTPLHYACRHGVPNSVNNLMGLNGSLYSKSKDKRSALHFAACYGRYNTCDRLLRFVHDARLLNEADEKGMTPLHLAAENGHDRIIFLLLKRGALMLSDYRGWAALHYAAHGGYTRTIKTILDTSHSLIDKPDKEKNTALHLAAKEGHAKAVALLLESGAAITLNTNDASFIHEAIRGGRKDVVYATIQTERWEEALVTFSDTSNYKCPILEMVYHLPESLKFLLDRCMTESPGDKKSPNYFIEYNFRYLQCPLQFKKASERTKSVQYEPLTTLNAMVQHNRVELLSHPVCKEYLTMKWRAYGFKAHLINLSIYSLGLIPLTLLIMSAMVPGSPSNNSTSISSSNSEQEPLQLKDSYFTRICMSIVLFMSIFGMLKEIIQMGQQKLGYLLDSSNAVDWTIHISSIVFVSSICTMSTDVEFWQWQAGAVAVFASWVNFLIYLQRFETCGIYIVMFWEILRTLIRIVVLFFFLILAFGLSFFVLLYPQTPFSNPLLALMQTFTMMLGDINYHDGFLVPFLENQIENPVFTFLHLIVFTLLIPILLMNLLIGLAVGDIAEVQRNAALKRIAMQVSLHTNLEKKLPYWFLKRVDEMNCIVYPNLPRIWGHAVRSTLFKHFLECDGFKVEAPINDATMELELWKQKNRLKDLSSVMQKQHELIKLIIQKMEIVSEAEDEDNQDQLQHNKPRQQKMPEGKESKWDCVMKAVKCKNAN